MDFEIHYTEEQDRFRREVSAWLDVNLSEEVKCSGVLRELDLAKYGQRKILRRRLGERGWLAPTELVEWGGGGLTPAHALVLREELERRGLRWLLDEGESSLRSAIQQVGTEDQKRRYLPVISRGHATLWYLPLEPGIPLGTGNLGIRALRDGDDYVLNGEDLFVGQGPWPDYLWTLVLADPVALPHQSTAAFLIPGSLEGIRIQTLRTLVPGETHRVTFDNVWVPPYCLLGVEGEGSFLIQAALDAGSWIEYPSILDEEVTDLLQYARETTSDGATLSEVPHLQQALVEAYINSRITFLLRARNSWMATTGRKLTYHTAQAVLWEKQAALRLSQIVREVMGLYALLDHQDPRAPFQGKFELQQRRSLTRQNSAGTSDVQAEAIGMHLSFSQKREG